MGRHDLTRGCGDRWGGMILVEEEEEEEAIDDDGDENVRLRCLFEGGVPHLQARTATGRFG